MCCYRPDGAGGLRYSAVVPDPLTEASYVATLVHCTNFGDIVFSYGRRRVAEERSRFGFFLLFIVLLQPIRNPITDDGEGRIVVLCRPVNVISGDQ